MIAEDNNKNPQSQHFFISRNLKEDTLLEYNDLYVQRIPRYGIKYIGNEWVTKKKALSDIPIRIHLEDGKYSVGVLGKWYPCHCTIDIDNKDISEVEDIMETLGFDSNNSMLQETESKDCYHLHFIPEINSKPPTLRALQIPFKNVGGIDVYPQVNRFIRLPFPARCRLIDYDHAQLKTIDEKVYWFKKLTPVELLLIKTEFQLEIDYVQDVKINRYSTYQEGKELLITGLQFFSSRHNSQYKVIYYHWRENVDPEVVKKTVWQWIREKHNGFSKDIINYPEQVYKEIVRQTNHVYDNYEYQGIYPDSTHNYYKGYITEPDLREIIRVCGGDMPRMKFLFNLVKYYYPRRHRDFINVHSDKLRSWAGARTNLLYLNELEEKKIIVRGKKYSAERFSKNVKLNWGFQDKNKAILYDLRAPEGFKETIRLAYKPGEFKELLINEGKDRRDMPKIIKNIYINQNKNVGKRHNI